MFQHHRDSRFLRFSRSAAALLLGGMAAASAGTASTPVDPPSPVLLNSPTPERMAARDAWRLAEAFLAANSDCDVMMGSGGSMLPLYPDHTVLIVRRLPVSDLRMGMTVVFIGDRGRPVAHILVEKTSRGWLAKGLANAGTDRTFVRADNYVGAVVRAFRPTIGLASSAPAENTLAGQ